MKTMIAKRQLVACCSNARFLYTLKSTADELGAELRTLTPKELVITPALSAADCLIVQFSEFDSAATALIDECRRTFPDIPMIAVLNGSAASETQPFLRFGVFDCLTTSSSCDEIFHTLELAQSNLTRLRSAHSAASVEPWRRHLVGSSSSIEQVTRVIKLVASRRCTVLISGETGTGKEMAARAIHMASDRARKPMVSVNCSAIPENLIEAELFGHVKGAFTGAVNHRVGRFEQANGGTLFLDEIGDLPLDLQAKLLRVLQERELQRLGSGETIKVDVRVIAATNLNLLARVQQGTFREDLYYRLNVVPIQMPALRDRRSDVGVLAHHFVEKVCQAEGLETKEVSAEAMELLSKYNWPGNVRQLENVIEHAIVMSGDRTRLFPSDFAIPRPVQAHVVPVIEIPSGHRLPDEGLDYSEALRQFERAILQQALSKAQGNKTIAADMLRLPRTTLIHKLRVLEFAAA